VRSERDRLASTAERNMLGQLKGTAGSWQQLVSAYEKGGECANPFTVTDTSVNSTALLRWPQDPTTAHCGDAYTCHTR
jgi:hypothetical protein